MKRVILPAVPTPNSQHTASFGRCFFVLALVFFPLSSLDAQESPFAAALKTALIQPVSSSSFVEPTAPADRQHRFWDRENCMLFAAVGAMNTADFYVTRQNLAHGGKELNPITRPFAGSTTGLAFNFAGETATYIAASYLFHRGGHHRLERIASFASIGSSAGAVTYDLTHR